MTSRTALQVLFAAALWWAATAAAGLVAVPPLTARVTDTTATLTPEQIGQLEQTLVAFETRKGAQIAVLVVPTTAPEAIEQYGLRVVEQWKIGRSKVDDGALLIVAKDDRTVRIEVGYGLEGVLTDAMSSRIIRDIIAPRFRENDYFGGISAGIDAISRTIEGEALPAPAPGADAPAPDLRTIAVPGFILVVVLGHVLRTGVGRTPAAAIVGVATAAVVWWLIGTLLVALMAGAMAGLITLSGIGPGFMGGYGGRHGGGFRGGGGRFGGGGGGASGRW